VGQLLDQASQIIKVARQAIHAVPDHGVALADKAEQRLELRPLGVLAGGLVDEEAIDRDLIELTLGVLLEGADLNLADTLSRHALSGVLCQLEILDS
jgi:hypothetical protein